jgi:3-oxoacyl-[acyl-carrier-protein] synthase-1
MKTIQGLSIYSFGMVTGVGLDAPASCAAVRAAIDNFQETRFMDKGGDLIIGSEVPLEKSWRGRTKLLELVKPAITECLKTIHNSYHDQIPLLLCLAEKNRPGRLEGLDETFLSDVQSSLGIRFHEKSMVFEMGRIGGVKAVTFARKLLYENRLPYCLIAGVDSLLVGSTLEAYDQKNRLITGENSDGFLPGEAGAAILVESLKRSNKPQMVIMGVGFGKEEATIESEEPFRAEGIVTAIKNALNESDLPMHAMDLRITDVSGEQYYFKEASLALTRLLRERKQEFDIWHPADCIGEVGAAIAPSAAIISVTAAQKKYAPGNRILCHFGNDSGDRAAMVLGYFPAGIE